VAINGSKLELTIGAGSSTAPTSISPASGSFVEGAGGTIQLSANGNPAPTFALAGNPPSGVGISSTGLLTVPAGLPAATYVLSIQLSNPNPVTFPFTLTIRPASQPVATPVPTLSGLALAMLVLLLAGLAGRNRRA
jgi:hypothetical protein